MSSSIKYLTTGEYAQHAGISASTVSKWLRSGKLKGEKQNGKWMIPVDETVSKAASPAAAPKSSPSKSTETKAAPSTGGQSYSIEKFSEMTYLTEFGVEKWLKQGRLKGIKDSTGQWQVSADNLQLSHVQRLLRN
jgi:predicted site-specific integrase-resolvase